MKFEIIYKIGSDGEIYWLYQKEAQTMKDHGIQIGVKPSDEASSLLRRSFIVDKDQYPSDPRYIQNAQTYWNYNCTECWYPIIKDITIPTVFVDKLGEDAIRKIHSLGWEQAFVKNAVKSLVEDSPLDSVWPNVSFEKMNEKFAENPRKGTYALREYREAKIFEQEKRYWVIGDSIHHSSGEIPDIVREAVRRLEIFGGIFYTVDATPDLIVEINAGESSDRKTDNTADDFAKWIAEAFC